MWSKELQELSKVYFEIDGTHVKSANGNFGILSIDYKNKIYTISIKPDFNVNLTFHSVMGLSSLAGLSIKSFFLLCIYLSRKYFG